MFSIVAGIYKKGLSVNNQEDFFFRVIPEINKSPGVVLEHFKGENFVAVGASFKSQNRTGDCTPEMGGSQLSVCVEQTNLKTELSRVVAKLDFNWSLGLVNDHQGVVLGRDNAGAQTMYYYQKDGALVFGTSLTVFRNFGWAIDQNAIADFLHFLYIPAPRTIYCDVHAVLPGQFVFLDGSKAVFDKIPTTEKVATSFPVSSAKTDEQILLLYEEYLQSSVQRCCPKEAKVGLFLSGGKDSSSLAIAARNSGLQNIEAITLGFSDSEIDETDDARMVAEHLGIPFRPLKFTAETYFELWPEFIRKMGQPIGDCAALPVFAALQDATDSYDMFLDGSGNDECFLSPISWQEDFAWQIHRIFPGLHRLPWNVLPTGGSYSLGVIARYLSTPREEQFVSWNGWAAAEIERLTGRKPDWRDSRLYGLYESSLSSKEHKTNTLNYIWEPETSYRKVVQLANLAWKSVRYPFLDQGLTAFSHNLPDRLKFTGRTNKVLLRRLLDKYLPQEIVNKKKGSFNFPKKHILATNDYEYINVFLSPACIRKHGLVEVPPVTDVVERYRRGDNSVEDRVWSMVLLQSWAELGVN